MKVRFLILLMLSPSVIASTGHIDSIRDLTQTEIEARGAGGGQQYCAPVAVSNTFSSWLAHDVKEQKELAVVLAQDYMNTSTKSGTGTAGVMNGVAGYANDFLGGYKLLEYQGWRKHPERFAASTKIPDIKRLVSAISANSAAWLNIGWYKGVKGTSDYRRIGGHWVTLVGATKNQLVLHDPAPRAGRVFSNEFVSYSVLGKGTLTGKKSGLPTPARGYIRLQAGMHLKSSADHAIVDGVVFFER